MSQVKPPKEFKFVGGPSRKRRRRVGPKLVPNTPKAAFTPNHDTVRIDEPQVDSDKTTPRPTCLDSQTPSQVLNGPPYIDQDAINAPELLSPSMATAASKLSDPLDWLSASSMNPFFDPGLTFTSPFDQGGLQPHLPFYFGPDVPFVHLGDSPPTDSSTHEITADAAADAALEDDDSARGSPTTGATAFEFDDVSQPSLSLPHAPGNISGTISQLLTRYDQEYCVMPLTHDFDANPFRFNAETGRGSQLLLHCILALSYKHIHRDTGTCLTEAKSYKKKALQMLRDMENDSQDGNSPPSSLEANFLDAVLILMTLDCATSAHGPWMSYLKRAMKMIQATEGLHIQKTPRMQARIEMLVWWDVTLALTSRRGCVLSEATTISLFNPKGSDAPTFYSVSGCPEDLFRHMIRLGAYAREFELAATMTCVKFDMGPVLAAEKGIREWSDPQHFSEYPESTPDLSAVEDPGDVAHHKEDLHHCAEAWRYGLLIYVERVFKWNRNGSASSILGFLARKTLNHVSACRRSTMVQKQLLLPVFLAGCETTDERLRQEARSYCAWWNEKTRYDMFLTATALLEEVWAQDDSLSWWGSIIDQKTRFTSDGRSEKQYLFG